MRISLKDNSISLVSGSALLPHARWSLNSPMFVLVSNCLTYQDFRRSEDVLGSINFLYSENDDWHFRKSDGQLVEACFRIPEKKLVSLPHDFLKNSQVQESKVLLEHKRNVSIESMSYRYLAPDYEYLVCLNRIEEIESVIRVKVCPNLYLLVHEKNLVGWLLESPIESLDTGSKDTVEPVARDAIGLYMEHFHEDSYEDIEDGLYEDLIKIKRIKSLLDMNNEVSNYVWRAIYETLESLT